MTAGIEPYFADEHVQLYLGDMRELLPELGVRADVCITDPPYGETALAWDRWPGGWPALVANRTSSLWCFGSMRMFLDRASDFETWTLAQDVVWEKHNGTGSAADRFRRVHEHITHWYRGPWRELHHVVPRVPAVYDAKGRTKSATRVQHGAHHGTIAPHHYEDDGLRLTRSVLKAGSVRGGLHPTEKPGAVLAPLIEYSTVKGGLVLDPFAGSASTLLTARQLGRRAIGIEANEEYCERAAKRLSEVDLFSGGAA